MQGSKWLPEGAVELWNYEEVMRGFIVVSWMIQSFLCLLLVFFSFSLFMQWHKQVRNMHNRLNRFLAVPMACEVLQRDLQVTAPNNAQINHYSLSLNMPLHHKKITWLFDKDKLLRKQRVFDVKHRVWKKTVKNLVAEKLILGSFERIKNQSALLVGMKMAITLEDCKRYQEYIIAFRNGKQV